MWEAHFSDVFMHDVLADLFRRVVVGVGIGAPPKQTDDFVTLEEEVVLSEEEGTLGTMLSLINRPSITLVMLYSPIISINYRTSPSSIEASLKHIYEKPWIFKSSLKVKIIIGKELLACLKGRDGDPERQGLCGYI